MTAAKRFGRLPAAKQEAIIEAATGEFSRHGFEHANTNVIARRAGVSVGSLYQYFATKEDLFLHIVHLSAAKIRARVEELVVRPAPVLTKIAELIGVIQETSRSQRQDIELYHELTAAGNRTLARQLVQELEGYTAGAYTTLIAEGQRNGEIRDDIPAAMLAFLIDNLFMSLQYAYACTYFTDRFELYLGPDILDRDDAVADQVLSFLTAAARKGQG